MDLIKDWDKIRKHFNTSFRTSFHVAIGSVDAEIGPTVTPIGTLFLNDNQRGFYFEKFTARLPGHAGQNSRVCVLGVNSGRRFWIRSLFRNRFNSFPGIRLYGALGQKRKATDEELARLKRRMKVTRAFKRK